MNKTISQKRRFITRKHTLFENRVLIETTSLSKNTKYEIPLDVLGKEIVYQSESTIPGKIVFGVCLFIPLIVLTAYFLGSGMDSATLWLNLIIWPGIALLGYLKTNQDDIFLAGGQKSLVFFRSIPSEQEVLSFIHEVIASSKVFIKAKYGTVDPVVPQDLFFGRIVWMKENDIITESEYNEMKHEYETKKLLGNSGT